MSKRPTGYEFTKGFGGVVRYVCQKALTVTASLVGKALPQGRARRAIKRVYDKCITLVRPKIAYSKTWYDEVYHPAICAGQDFHEYVKTWQEYVRRIDEVLVALDLPGEKITNWLEVACMQGKTAYAILQRYPHVHMYMFDFSETAVDWLRKNFPTNYKWTLWRGDIRNIRNGDATYDGYFDVITCIDVTEHLPGEIYIDGIGEMYRVLKPGGCLILMQGNTHQPEHIHILSEEELVRDFCARGFDYIKTLPHRHHLFTKGANE